MLENIKMSLASNLELTHSTGIDRIRLSREKN